MNLVDNKQPHYSHLDNLSKNELPILHIYINKILIIKFIRLSKSLARAIITFFSQLNRDLQLCIDY